MGIVKAIIGNRNLVMLLGVAVGLVWGKGAALAEPLTLPALALIMTAATIGIDVSRLRSAKEIFFPAFTGVLMNYVVLGSVILVLSRCFISDADFRAGFVLVAAVPPAVAVIPFTYLLRGDRRLSLMGTLGGYLAALVLMPFMVMVFLGSPLMAPGKLLVIVGELILLPLVAGHIINRTGIDKHIEPYKGAITNWGFSFLTFIIVGLNRGIFIHRPLSLLPTALIVVATTFLLGWAIEIVAGKFMKLGPETVISIVLMGTLKNYGIAGGLALTLFGREAASPSTVSAVFMIVYIIWLEWRLRRKKKG